MIKKKSFLQCLTKLANNAVCEAIDCEKGELLGTKWFDKLPPEELSQIKDYNRIRLQGDTSAPIKYELKYSTKNKEIRSALFSVSTIDEHRKGSFLLLVGNLITFSN